jgi:hypothetical protein
MLKREAIAIVEQVEPDDVFVVEDGFDAMVDAWNKASAQDEGRFGGVEGLATFAAIITPFLVGLFEDYIKDFAKDVAKDLAKDQAKKRLTALIDRLLGRKSESDEGNDIRTDIDVAIAKSKFSPKQKEILMRGFEKLLGNVAKGQ